MDALHPARERAAHPEPHNHLDPFGAAALHIGVVIEPGQRLGLGFEQIEEFIVPCRVDKTGAGTLHLMRQAAGADHRDLNVARVVLHRAADRPPSFHNRRAVGNGCG